MKNKRDLSLTQLERHDWGPPSDPSYLVRTIHQLRYKPLRDFTVEDLRIAIGQRVSLPHLMPLAIERLEENPLAEGHYYPGDLVQVVLSAPSDYWLKYPAAYRQVASIAQRALAQLNQHNQSDSLTRSTIENAFATFTAAGPTVE